MASSPLSPLSRAFTLEKTLECPICSEIYDDPKALPCMHTYCGNCIDQWIRNNADSGQPTCPDCRQPFGPETVRGAFQLRRITELQRQYVQQNTKQSSTGDQDTTDAMPTGKCSGCNSTESSFVFCCDCDQLLCATCSLVHRTHDLKSTAEVFQTTKEKIAAYIEKMEFMKLSNQKSIEASDKTLLEEQDRLEIIREQIHERAETTVTAIRNLENDLMKQAEHFIAQEKQKHQGWKENEERRITNVEKHIKFYGEMLSRNSEKEITKPGTRMSLLENSRSLYNFHTAQLWRNIALQFHCCPKLGKLVFSKDVSYVTMVTGFKSSKIPGDFPMEDDPAQSKGMIRFIVANFSTLNKVILSEPVYIRDLLWCIKLMPQFIPPGQEKNVPLNKKLGLFLECSPEDKATKSWSCQSLSKLKLISQTQGVEDLTKEIPQRFSDESKQWGFQNFLAWNDVLDPSKGYINKADTIIVEAHISADPLQSVKVVPLQAVVKKTVSRKRGRQSRKKK